MRPASLPQPRAGPPVKSTPYWAEEDTAIDFATSWCISPFWLGCLRLLWAVYAFSVLFVTIGIEVANNVSVAAGLQFAYFTSLNYWALAFYFLFAAYHSLTYSRTLSTPRPRPALANWSTALRWAHAALHTTITTYPIVITLVFWTVLRQNAFFNRFAVWNNVSQHALNSAMALLELGITRSPPASWGMLIPVVVVLALYLAETYVFHAARGYYVYPFLDPANGVGLVVGAIFGVLLGTVLVFVVVRYLVVLRIWATETRRAKKSSNGAGDERVGGGLNHDREFVVPGTKREEQMWKMMGRS